MSKIICNLGEISEEYTPYDSENVCLSDEFVQELLYRINAEKPVRKEMLETIATVERNHREMVQGVITKVEEEQRYDILTNQVREKFKLWFHEMEDVVRFYEMINGENVL